MGEKERYLFYLYDKDRKPPYKTHGKVLSRIQNPIVLFKLNDISELTFDYPMDAEEVQCFRPNNIVAYMGRPFRMKRFTETHNAADEPIVSVTCYDALMMDMGNKVIPDFFMVGKTPREMLVKAFEGTEYHILTEAEVKAKGLEWWDVATDLELNRTSPLKVLQQVIELTGGGEVYLDGYNVALVKNIGQKRYTPLRFGTNLQRLERDVDAQNLITIVYPVGQDDLHIDYVTQGNQQFIRSKWADVFGETEGYAEYSDIEALGEDDPDSFNGASVLYWTACANMDAPIYCGNGNLKQEKNKYVNTDGTKNKLDLPVIEYRVTFTDLAFLEGKQDYAYNLGDIVPIIDEYFCINTGKGQENDYLNLEQQVIELEIHPNEPTENAMRLGQNKRTIGMNISDGKQSMEYITSNTDKDGNIKEDSVEGTEYTETLTIIPNGDDTVQITDRFGVRSLGHVYYDNTKNPQYAVCVSKSVIAMGSKNGNKWSWYNVISNGKGHLDSHMWLGSLSTTLVDIMSDNGKLTIQDSLISVFDKNGTARLKIGYAGGQFVFEMCAEDGIKTVGISGNGEAEITGTMYASRFIGTGKENYESIEKVSGETVSNVFAEIDERGIKVNQDENGKRKQKIGMTADSQGDAILVLGEGNGSNRSVVNGVAYSDDSFIVTKSDGVTVMTLRGTNSSVAFYNNSSGQYVTVDGIKVTDLQSRITSLERRVSSLESAAG